MTDDELKQLVESNARAIQALGDQISELTSDVTLIANSVNGLTEAGKRADIERAELRQAMIGIANLLSSLDEDRPTILRKLSTLENKVDRLLERGEPGASA